MFWSLVDQIQHDYNVEWSLKLSALRKFERILIGVVVIMHAKEEQRAEIWFCVRSGMSPTETFERLRRIHGGATLSKSSVFRWHSRIRGGDNNLKDRDHNPGPRKLTAQKIQEVQQFVGADKRRTVRQVAAHVNLSRGICSCSAPEKVGFAQDIRNLYTASSDSCRKAQACHSSQSSTPTSQASTSPCAHHNW